MNRIWVGHTVNRKLSGTSAAFGGNQKANVRAATHLSWTRKQVPGALRRPETQNANPQGKCGVISTSEGRKRVRANPAGLRKTIADVKRIFSTGDQKRDLFFAIGSTNKKAEEEKRSAAQTTG